MSVIPSVCLAFGEGFLQVAFVALFLASAAVAGLVPDADQC